ncbi:MAG: sulfite exporter TauE/SafE family protein [Chloroflexi bacterium]|nr:sulfite exporter TauE/SafE family protein [Chloroflexota bacterium]
MDPVVTVVGLAVGTLVGMSGMGGAALMAPLLILLGFRPITVVGTDLAYSVITKLVGSAYHLRHGQVDGPTVIALARGSVPGALGGIVILKLIGPGRVDALVSRALGAALVLVGLSMLFRAAFPSARTARVGPWGLSALGTGIGVLVSLTSVGSGSLVAAVLAMTTSLSARAIVGTDLVHGFVLVLVAALGHWQVGTIDFALSANLLTGAVPGVLIGSRLSSRMPERALRPTLAVVLLATGLRML